MINLLVLAAVFLSPAIVEAAACGGMEAPCEIEGGTYHIVLPEGLAKGTIMHLHGGGATGRGVLDSKIADAALGRGYVLIAPQGWHPENRWQKDWSVPGKGMSYKRDDVGFLRAVLADVEGRHSVAVDDILLSGFSRGGSMVWTIACETPDLARAYAPVAGAFWDHLPESCASPVDLFHTHGWTDRVVPLEGRSFDDGRVVQGDVWASLFVLRATNGCVNRQPETALVEGSLWFRHWSDCSAGQIDLMLHPGGHGPPEGWIDRVLDWFEARLRESQS